MIQASHSILVLLLILVGLSSCSVEQQLQKSRNELTQDYDALPPYDTLPRRTITWHQALEMVEKNNLEMQQAAESLREARRGCDKIYRDLIPMVNMGYYYNMALKKNQYADNRTGQFDFNIIFSLPELVQLPIQHYTAALAAYKAEQNIELKRRELTAKLYQFFRLQEIQKQATDQELHQWSDDKPSMKMAIDKRKEKEERAQWLQICELLNNYDARWQLYTPSLPRLTPDDYREQAKRPSDLSITQAAMELEASRLRKKGVALRYWPSLHVQFYSPSLFNMSGGNMTGFMSLDDARIDMNTYLSLDTRLETWNEYLSAKAQHELLEQQLRKSMYEHREKLQLLMSSWAEYNDWKEAMQNFITFRKQHGITNSAAAKALHDESMQVQSAILAQERENLERECALIQEYGLPGSEKKLSQHN